MKIKRGSRGDIHVLRPTLMAVVPVSQEALTRFGAFYTAKRPANTHFEDYFEETEKYLPRDALSQEILDRLFKNVVTKLADMNKVQRTVFQMTYNYKLRKMAKGYNTRLCDKY